jgi:hypothetical protein
MCVCSHFARQRAVITKGYLIYWSDKIQVWPTDSRTWHRISYSVRQSGDHTAHQPFDDWCQTLGRTGSRYERHSTSCAMRKNRNPQRPHLESACGDGSRVSPVCRTERQSHPPPVRIYAQHGQQNIFLPLSSTHDMNHCLPLLCRLGLCMKIVALITRFHVFMYKASPPPYLPSSLPIPFRARHVTIPFTDHHSTHYPSV